MLWKELENFGSGEVASPAEEPVVGETQRGSQDCATQTAGADMRSAGTQTETSLPRHLEAIWTCHCVGAETIVDPGECDEEPLPHHSTVAEIEESVKERDPRPDATRRGPQIAEIDNVEVAMSDNSYAEASRLTDVLFDFGHLDISEIEAEESSNDSDGSVDHPRAPAPIDRDWDDMVQNLIAHWEGLCMPILTKSNDNGNGGESNGEGGDDLEGLPRLVDDDNTPKELEPLDEDEDYFQKIGETPGWPNAKAKVRRSKRLETSTIREMSDLEIAGEEFLRAELGPVTATSVMMQSWFGIMTSTAQDVWQDAVIRHEMIEKINLKEVTVHPMPKLYTKNEYEKYFDFDELEKSEQSVLRQVDAIDKSGKGRTAVAKTAKKVGGRRFRLARGITVDSGAADNVMPRRLLRGGRVRPSKASEAGVHYVAANNGRIPNEGEADLEFKSAEGHPHSWTFQIAEVNKVLAAVSALVDSGCRVVFDRDAKTGSDISFIVDKATGVETKLRRENNVWVVDAWVEDTDEDFRRPE